MIARLGLEGLAEDLAEYRRLVGTTNLVVARGVAELAALLTGPRANAAIVDRLARAWRRRAFLGFYERPLLLMAALRLEALAGGPSHPLAAALATEPPSPRAFTAEALAAALDPDRLPIWLTLATRRMQTNDVSRAVAWRWPASLVGARPLVLVDVGCSAGLVLVADRLALDWTDEGGQSLPQYHGTVLARLGFDADPLDPGRSADVAWLRACIWAGDVERQQHLEEAIAAFARARDDGDAPTIERVRARHVPARLQRIERSADPSALVCVVQTLVRRYLDVSEATPYVREMEAWVDAQRPGRALWLELELAEDGRTPPAVLVARAPGTGPITLARTSPHPLELAVDTHAVDRLRTALQRSTDNARRDR